MPGEFASGALLARERSRVWPPPLWLTFVPRYGFDDAAVADVDVALASLGIERRGEIVEFEEGWSTTCLAVDTTEGRLVVRSLPMGQEAAGRFDLEVMTYLHGAGFPVPRVRQAKTPTGLFVLRGRPALIMSYVAGVHPRRDEPGWRQLIGRWLAWMHDLTEALEPEEPKTSRAESWIEHARTQGDAIRGRELGPVADAIDSLELQHVAASARELPTAIVHGDPYYANYIVEDRSLRALIDFDTCHRGAMVEDVAWAVMWWTDPNASPWPATAEAKEIIDGYESIRRLGRQELDALPMFLEFACVARLARAASGLEHWLPTRLPQLPYYRWYSEVRR